MRSILLLMLAVAATALRASAATVDVFTYNEQFSLNQPGQPVVTTVTIYAGDSVRWVWLQGNHRTVAAVGSPEQWNAPVDQNFPTYTRQFNNAGTFWYRCDPHGVDNGDGTTGGMHGIVQVLPSGFGACCKPDGSCEVLEANACIAAGGVFQGSGSSCATAGCTVEPIVVTLQAAADAMLFESPTGTIANGAGIHHYLGNASNGSRRRFAIRFDSSAIPSGSTVVTAELAIRCNQTSGSATSVAAHRALASWAEGPTDPSGNESSGATAVASDLTWLHRVYPSDFWATAGGEFTSSASATRSVSAVGVATWSGSGLASDVQGWVDTPGSNFGWIMRGDEATGANTKRFDSRSTGTIADRPTLRITYLPPQPTGACCLSNGSCLEVSEQACVGLGGSYRGDGTLCADASCPISLEPFVDPLPLPAVAQPVSGEQGGAATYEIAMTEAFQQLHRDLPPTRVWTYGGSFPGPTIEARSGLPVQVVWKNQLRVFETGALRTVHALSVDDCLHGPDKTGDVPYTVVHLHGAKVDQLSDGYPDFAFPPGEQSLPYLYPNDQPAATIWYHDHGLGLTRLNVLMGLAGFYLIRDDAEDALALPSGPYELPLAIQDRTFEVDGSFRSWPEWTDHYFGDKILVNGKVWPYHEVARGKYRLRLLNGSNSRVYTLALSDGATFWQIATDQGLVGSPRPLTAITLLPGERSDIVVDFAGYAPGTRVELRNSAPAPYPGFGSVGVVPEVMEFRVGSATGHVAPLPTVLVPYEPIDPAEAVVERVLELMIAPNLDCPSNRNGMWMIDGLGWDTVTERPIQGTTELWTWKNESGVSHPMHMHLVALQLVGRQLIDTTTGLPTGPVIPPDGYEVGWKDTVDARPGYFTTVIARFDGPAGRFPYHCHILEHEDHEMMRQFELLADCDGNGIADIEELAKPGADCNANGALDACEIADGAADCNGNGVLDSCELASGGADCNSNGLLDQCDLASGSSSDLDGNGVPDECQTDCNANGLPDSYEIAQGLASDCNLNGQLDSCEIAGGGALDCNANGVLDSCEIAGGAADCNANGVLDSCEIAGGASDCDADGVPDSCEIAGGASDCDADGVPDSCEIAGGAVDCNTNGVLDSCEIASGASDCDADGVLDSCEIAQGTARDCNGNGVPDSCDIAAGAADIDADGKIDACERAYGDFDLDGVVGGADLATLLGVWAQPNPQVGDLNADGTVSAADLAILLGRWGPVPQ
ncbi:MAG: multicopper oxidase domain-containing protein [Planctomycetaceae bacterium]|nr:multicopper oxidase domain-containing protein [Planctomycetaceae bacterium]